MHISEQTIQKVREISVVDVISQFLSLRLIRGKYQCLCPFHNDTHTGNFYVVPQKNMYKCFACDAHGDGIKFVMDYCNETFEEAVTHIAKLFGINVTESTSDVRWENVPRQIQNVYIAKELPTVIFDKKMTIQRRFKEGDGNVFCTWFRNLPWENGDYKDAILKIYNVGTSLKGDTKGWVIWWYMDENFNLRTGKMMKYLPNGHRDKRVNPRWIHTNLEKQGVWSSETHKCEICLYGQHLIDVYPDAEICIVESEKTALICQAHAHINEKLFLACGGLQRLNRKLLEPLIKRNRWIILYPDIDGYDKWKAKAKEIGYERLQVSRKPKELFDSDIYDSKSDIADILVTKMEKSYTQLIQQKVKKQLGITEHPALDMLIDRLQLTYQ